MDDIKRCSKCDIVKELSEFSFREDTKKIEINVEIVLNWYSKKIKL